VLWRLNSPHRLKIVGSENHYHSSVFGMLKQKEGTSYASKL
jgi:hypothetical protein